MDRLCRICRTSESVDELIGFYDNINVLVDFYFITGITIVDIDPKNPALICSTCIDNIKIFTKFKRKAKKSDEFFREQNKSFEETFWNKERSENYGPNPFIKQEPELLTKISYWADIGNITQTTCNVDFIDENDEICDAAENELMDADDSDGSGYFEGNGPEFVSEFSEYCEVLDKKPKVKSKKHTEDSSDDQDDSSYQPNQSLNGKSLQCNVCGKEVKTNRSLKLHLSVVHNLDDKVYICKHCDKIFKHELYVKKHVKKHHGMQFLKSRDLIVKKVKNREKSPVNFHNKPKVNTEKLGNPNSKYCKICEREFSSVRSCRDHFKTAHGADKSVYVCRICESRFKIRLYLLRHVKKKHGIQATENHYTIEEEESEEEEFEEIDRDIVEIAKPTSKDSLNYCCYCDKSFSSGRTYREHMKIRHETDDKVYICKFCSDKFIVMTYLKRHVKKTHGHVLKAHEVIVKRKGDRKEGKVKIKVKKEMTEAKESCVENTVK